MREIALDTETTGLDPKSGDRVVEIGCVEMFNRVTTGKIYHQYINPKRSMPIEAYNVHGLSEEFLSKHPPFEDIIADFLEFIGDSKLVIHNAAFDMRFINAELYLAGSNALPDHQAIDTLKIARQKFPGSPSTLDALCRRFNIDNSARTKHGALLDAELLAEMYLELMGGRQESLMSTNHSDNVDIQANSNIITLSEHIEQSDYSDRKITITTPNAIENSNHQDFINSLQGSLWQKLK